MNNHHLFKQLTLLTSERRNHRSRNIDSLNEEAVLHIINAEDKKVAIAVAKEIPSIAKATSLIVSSFRNGGRLIYVGAGTSGRLGILDAAECPPTYGTDPRMVRGIMAGGKEAVFRSQEGVEDFTKDGAQAIRREKVGKKDTVCGIAASMRTPFVIGALQEAKRRGAKTILVTVNPRSLLRKKQFADLRKNLDVAICAEVGPEVIMGSTRMKAGTAQKLILNMLTTSSMIQVGKVYENLMVDVKMNSRKLEERAKRVLMIAANVNYETAAAHLRKSNGHVKTALVMIKSKVSASEARESLRKSDGFVRKALLLPRPRRGNNS